MVWENDYGGQIENLTWEINLKVMKWDTGKWMRSASPDWCGPFLRLCVGKSPFQNPPPFHLPFSAFDIFFKECQSKSTLLIRWICALLVWKDLPLFKCVRYKNYCIWFGRQERELAGKQMTIQIEIFYRIYEKHSINMTW